MTDAPATLAEVRRALVRHREIGLRTSGLLLEEAELLAEAIVAAEARAGRVFDRVVALTGEPMTDAAIDALEAILRKDHAEFGGNSFVVSTPGEMLSWIERIRADQATIATLTAARDAALARAMPRPIETAPKDGTRIILGGMTSGGPGVDVGQWSIGRYLGRKQGYRRTWVTHPGCEVEPTCWWPLPDAPSLPIPPAPATTEE